MLEIVFYCLGVMYTPGPVNILSLNCGLQSRFTAHIPFCCGVGTALCLWFLLVGYAGSAVIGDRMLPVVSALGSAFILYLAFKILTSNVKGMLSDTKLATFHFTDGLLMQLLNPKSFLAVLPVTTIQFPAAGIEGSQIAMWSTGLGAMGFGAPLAYAVVGAKISRHVENPRLLKTFNRVMGAALIYVALSMAYHHVYLAIGPF